MKCSMMKAIVICGALAFAVAGCKYDDEAADGTGGETVATEIPTDGDGVAPGSGTDVTTDPGATTAVDTTNADTTSLTDAIGNVPFDQDSNYARCTDVDFAPVYFGFDASALPAGEMTKIEAVAAHLQEKPGRVVIIEGNCDERGSNEYNLSLGDLRATSIRAYLESLGIAPNRIQTKSYGEEKPAVIGHDESAWSKNRRGEFAVFQHK